MTSYHPDGTSIPSIPCGALHPDQDRRKSGKKKIETTEAPLPAREQQRLENTIKTQCSVLKCDKSNFGREYEETCSCKEEPELLHFTENLKEYDSRQRSN